jgi:hypothetical protein
MHKAKKRFSDIDANKKKQIKSELEEKWFLWKEK